jgi:hypothetical protein
MKKEQPLRMRRSRITSIIAAVAALTLLCWPSATLRADTVLIYNVTDSGRNVGGGKTTRVNARCYFLFDYNTQKYVLIFTFATKQRKLYLDLPPQDFVFAPVSTSATASSTFFVITSQSLNPTFNAYAIFMNGVDKLLDLGGGHVGNFPPTVSGVIRSITTDGTPAGSSATMRNISMKLVSPLTIQANTADANLAAATVIVTEDLKRRGYQKL